MGPLQAIFFDIGDTLVFDDPPLPERFWRASKLAGLPLNTVLNGPHNTDNRAAAFRLGESYAITKYLEGVPYEQEDVLRETARCIIEALGMPAPQDSEWVLLRDAFLHEPVCRYVHPGALDLLAELRSRGFVLGAISDWEETLPETLEELGIAPYLEALSVSAIVGVTKPNPRLFSEALREARVSAVDSLHVGDFYELDVAGARSVGMAALLFDHQRRMPAADCPRVETFDAMAQYLTSLPCKAQ